MSIFSLMRIHSRMKALSWFSSVLLHVLVPLIIWGWTTGAISAMLSGDDLDPENMDISDLMPPEYLAPPEAIDISDKSILLDNGGDTDIQRELFKAFADSGGLVGDRTNWTQGPKVRFGHTVMNKYFSYYRSGFVGHYQTNDGLDVFILDGRNDPRFGKLLMHIPSMNFLRALTQRGGRYIYSYGTSTLAEAPVEGSLMFMGDGDQIYRLMWLPPTGRARYPTRLLYFPEEWDGAKEMRGDTQ